MTGLGTCNTLTCVKTRNKVEKFMVVFVEMVETLGRSKDNMDFL